MYIDFNQKPKSPKEMKVSYYNSAIFTNSYNNVINFK